MASGRSSAHRAWPLHRIGSIRSLKVIPSPSPFGRHDPGTSGGGAAGRGPVELQMCVEYPQRAGRESDRAVRMAASAAPRNDPQALTEAMVSGGIGTPGGDRLEIV